MDNCIAGGGGGGLAFCWSVHGSPHDAISSCRPPARHATSDHARRYRIHNSTLPVVRGLDVGKTRCRASVPAVKRRGTSKGKGSPYSITERRVPELISVLGSQPAGDVSHKPGGWLPLLSARPVVTLATLKRAATNFAAWCKTVALQCSGCDLNPSPSAPESSTLTTRLPSHYRGTLVPGIRDTM